MSEYEFFSDDTVVISYDPEEATNTLLSITEQLANKDTHDPVNNPAHYKVGGIETIDFIEAKKLGYHLGNVVKYVTRSDHKGRRLEDLKKARWYLDREIENEEKLK
jgi:hypothetical protein